MYVYDCNVILATAMKNISNKERIRDFTELTKDLKIRGINPGLHFMDNESSKKLKTAMIKMSIK